MGAGCLSNGVDVVQGADMTRRPEDITLRATASGAVLVSGAAVVFILWAIFAGVGVATPVVSQNLAAIGF
jgi:hypothetical protein